MPSTSVQIHSSEASSAAARMDAEKSDPPRPSVVGRPSAVAPLNPVTTGRIPLASSGRRCWSAFRAGGLHDRRGVAEHGVGDDDLGGVDGPRGMPDTSRYSAIINAERRSPMAMASSTDRGGRSPSISMPCAMRRKSAMSSRTPVSARPHCDRIAQQFLASLFVTLRETSHAGLDARFIARFGVPQGVQQQIGDTRHRRNHRQHGPPLLLLPCRWPRQPGCVRRNPCWCRRISSPSKLFIEFVPGRSTCDRE